MCTKKRHRHHTNFFRLFFGNGFVFPFKVFVSPLRWTHTVRRRPLALETRSHTRAADPGIDCGYRCERLARSSEVKLNKLPSSVSLSASIHLSLPGLSASGLFISLPLFPSVFFRVSAVLAASLTLFYLFSCSLSPLLLTVDEPVLPYCLLPTAASSPRPLHSCSLPSGHHL